MVKGKGLPVEHMEDLVFIYGCTLVTSWAAAAFYDHATDAQVSLASKTLKSGEPQIWFGAILVAR